jgi:hypothetical protein
MKCASCLVFALLLVSCNDHKIADTGGGDTVAVREEIADDSVTRGPLTSVFGYRFTIWGDFDGDGNRENLVEHYYSRRDGKEAYKFYDNVKDDSEIWDLVMDKRPYSFALSSNKAIDTLRISNVQQLFGIAYLKNEGDLNGDGTDEVSYVIDYADMSSTNTWHIMTYADKKWQELYSFPMWEWQLPDTPGIIHKYGLYGSEGLLTVPIIPENDTLNKRIEKVLKEFPGLVKKTGKNKIEVIYSNEEAEKDTVVVNLKKLR